MTEYIFTFCQRNERRKDCYHAIKAADWGEARRIMIDRFGTEWAFQYEDRERAGIKKFNLQEVKWPEKPE